MAKGGKMAKGSSLYIKEMIIEGLDFQKGKIKHENR